MNRTDPSHSAPEIYPSSFAGRCAQRASAFQRPHSTAASRGWRDLRSPRRMWRIAQVIHSRDPLTDNPYLPPGEEFTSEEAPPVQKPSWIIRIAVGALVGCLIGFLTRPIIIARPSTQLDAIRLKQTVISTATCSLIGGMLGLAQYFARRTALSRAERSSLRLKKPN